MDSPNGEGIYLSHMGNDNNNNKLSVIPQVGFREGNVYANMKVERFLKDPQLKYSIPK